MGDIPQACMATLSLRLPSAEKVETAPISMARPPSCSVRAGSLNVSKCTSPAAPSPRARILGAISFRSAIWKKVTRPSPAKTVRVANSQAT